MSERSLLQPALDLGPAVVAPEGLAVDHEERCAEHAGGDGASFSLLQAVSFQAGRSIRPRRRGVDAEILGASWRSVRRRSSRLAACEVGAQAGWAQGGAVATLCRPATRTRAPRSASGSETGPACFNGTPAKRAERSKSRSEYSRLIGYETGLFSSAAWKVAPSRMAWPVHRAAVARRQASIHSEAMYEYGDEKSK
jgi:hypothetical protein